MNKNELIEKAVIDFDGALPEPASVLLTTGASWKHSKNVAGKVLPAIKIDGYHGYEWHAKSDSYPIISNESWIVLCTREEFNAAADRMRGKPDWSECPAWGRYLAQDSNGKWHWYSQKPFLDDVSNWNTKERFGFSQDGKCLGDWRNTLEKRPEQKPLPSIADRYGVEIPWDGRNALPTDVDCNCEVEVTLALGGAKYTETGNANRFNWMLVKSYKVIDERYKPEPAPAKPWFEAGELPKTGTKCLCYFDDGRECWHECVVIGSIDDEIKNGYLAVSLIGKHERKLVWVNDFKPIKTDKEKAIEAAVKVISGEFEGLLAHVFNTPKDAAEKLYNAGLLRLPDQK